MKLSIRHRSAFFALVLMAMGWFAADAGAATSAWQPVGATGPTVIPAEQSEVQKLYVDAAGGTFTLTARKLAAEGLGDVTDTALFGEQTIVENVVTTSGEFAAGQRLEGYFLPPRTDVNFSIGSAMLISKAADIKEKQDLLTAYDSPATTAPLPNDATAAEVQAALESLAPIGPNNVEVSGGPGGPGASSPYTIMFKGALANTNVSLLEPGNDTLVGNATVRTPTQGGRGTSTLTLMAQNIGGATSSGTITLRATLPSGITALGSPTSPAVQFEAEAWSCESSTSTEIICTRDEAVRPGLTPPPLNAVIAAVPGATGGTVQIEISGGGAAPAISELPLTVSTTPAGPGFQTFVAGAFDENGNFDRRAGGHPFSASTAFFVNTVRTQKGYVLPPAEFKDITVKLPPGFLGNPNAVPGCPESTPTQDCNLDSMVGVVDPITERFGGWSLPGGWFPSPVFSTEAPIGYPAKFRFRIAESDEVNVVGSLRSDEDYGVDAASLRTPQIDQVLGVFFTFWGQPASSAFDHLRCKAPNPGLEGVGAIRNEIGCRPSGAEDKAFLTSPTNCAEQAANPPIISTTASIWQSPSEIFEKTFGIPAVTECENLKLESDFAVHSSTRATDSPADVSTTLTMPSEGLTDPQKLATPEIKDTVVTLPQGVTLNPSGANGLAACSLDQIGYKGGGFPMPNPMRFDKEPQTCPDASKIGSLELKSSLLADPLHGALYLAAQGDGNPFGSLFAVYLVVEDSDRGIIVKLPGKTEPDPQTGQIKATFVNLPQLPFESLKLDFKRGSHAPLATPETCGRFATKTVSTPWSAPESGPPLETDDGGQDFLMDAGPNGGGCAPTLQDRPFGLGLSAGSENVKAGAHTAFDINLSRPDGAQEIRSFSLKMPEGFTASLKGVSICSEGEIAAAAVRSGAEEQADPSCPANSQVGTTIVGAGPGPDPFYATGKVYLAGPYKGAPLSVAAITPAVAGPFDLGDVVVRSALFVNPKTAQVTAQTDPLPEFLDGVQLRIRDIRVKLDRPGFALNPTSCEAKSVEATVDGNSGATATLTNRFQVGNCGALGFKPNVKLQLHGKTKRGDYQRLIATVTARKGDANIARAAVTFPHSEFLAQEHIRTVCTRVQFAAKTCPRGSVYGFAEAVTPLLDEPLRGPVYLRSSDNPLPDLVAALRGPDRQPIEVELSGRTDSKNGGIRNTFDLVPDAPVTKFTLQLFGGKKSLIVNSRNLCAGKQRATVRMNGQNGKLRKFRPIVHNDCRKHRHGKHRRT
jgi:hypothetical protein